MPEPKPNLVGARWVAGEQVGVVGIITPWNVPIAIPAWKLAPALCHGNTVVFKLADLVPGYTWVLLDILHRAGLPDGVVNLVMGRGSVVGQTIVDSADVAALSCTGSGPTGAALAAKSAEVMRKVPLEMGGTTPFVVLAGADLDVVVECVTKGAIFSTGQRCTASSRIIVERAFLDKMTGRMAQSRVGDALAADTQIDPAVDESQLARNERYIEIGKAEGARLLAGGECVARTTKGFFQTPALFADCTNRMRVAPEEVFGPDAAVIAVKDYDEALAVTNDTKFGLSAGIATTILKLATHFMRTAENGLVIVNLPNAGVDVHVPFGGRKASSHGAREQGRNADEYFTTAKTAYTLA